MDISSSLRWQRAKPELNDLSSFPGPAQVAVLSAETMAKQMGEVPGNPGHPELTLEEYRKLPFLADPELVVRDGDVTAVYVLRDGRLYRAVFKRTRSGEAVFLSSFHRLDDARALDRLRERGEVLWPK